MALTSGTITFLFTDLESSTRLWEEYPDAMQGALARHDEILRREIVANGGVVVKATGDGLHAAFATAIGAIAGAVAAQHALIVEPWGETGPLRVRIGIHSGVAEFRDDDYFGPTLNRAARITATAHGGQVVVSHASEELARDELPAGVSLRDLGEHLLRDLSRPERVFQVVDPVLRSEFPPLRSLAASRGNLPSQLTSFVDRTADIAKLGQALLEARLVTITGAGGVGKTRLAVHVAANEATRFPDGTWFCELAAAGESDALVEVVAATLAVIPRPAASLAQSIVEHLRDRTLLLVLDNCEHLLDEAASLAASILRSCPDVRILATSRERCAIEGEQVLPLRALPTPQSASGAEVIAENDAVRLFSDRARNVRHNFSIDGGNADAVGEICRQLDGIPLAIELAAARTGAMQPAEIAERLGQRFQLLSGAARDRPEHQRTLQSTVDWSYSLLDERERAVFNRLGVFAGSFDVRAAEAVATGDALDEWDVLDALSGLVSKSMVTDEETSGGTTHYRMLETLRAYARDRLEGSGEAHTWHRRHAEYFAELAETLGPQLLGPRELTIQAGVRAVLDDLRAAIAWSLSCEDQAERELGLRIVAALGVEPAYDRTLGVGEWADRAIAFTEESSSAGRRTAVLAAAAWAAYARGDIPRMAALATDALRDALCADTPAPFMAHFVLAGSAAIYGQHDRMLGVVRDGRRALAAIDAPDVAFTFLLVAEALWSCVAGELATAAAPAREALSRARSHATPSLLAIALYAFGRSSWVEEPAVALAAVDEGIDLVRSGAADAVLGPALSLAATIRAHLGDERGALFNLQDAIVHDARLGDRVQVRTALERGVEVLTHVGEPRDAAVLFGCVTGDQTLRRFMSGPERALHDQAAERARTELGAEEFDRAAAEGSAMQPDEIVGWTLGELGRLLAARA